MQDHPQDPTNPVIGATPAGEPFPGAAEPRPVELSGQAPDAEPAEVQAARTRLYDEKAASMTRGEEKAALDWFLGPSAVLEYDVPFKFETPAGMKTVIAHLRQIDGARIEQIDAANRSGDGPFAKLDTYAYQCEVVAEALLYFQDPVTGRKVDANSQEFTRGLPGGKALALQVQFKRQPGVLAGLEARIQEAAGFTGDRVGSANRSLVEAGKG